MLPGHYVPQLAQLMTQFNRKHKLFNLKGIAVRIIVIVSDYLLNENEFCDD